MVTNIDIIVSNFKGNRTSVAFKHLYDALNKPIYALCKRYFCNINDAQDALQETFITIYNKIDSYTNKGSFEGWAKRVAINTCLQKIKANKKIVFITNNNFEAEDIVDDYNPALLQLIENKQDALLISMEQLPVQYKTVLNLYVVENFSHQEIGALLHITESNSKVLLNRAKTLLKNKLEQNVAKINTI